MLKKLKNRIIYLESQIAAGPRLDGGSLEGAKKKLKELKSKLKEKENEIH